MNVLVCAGGTGGGIYPALAAVAELGTLGLATEDICWIGVRGEMEETLVPRAGIRLERIAGGPVVGVPAHIRVKNGLKLIWSIALAHRIMGRFQPDVLFVTGGYMSVPVAVAARLRRVPALVFLPDIEPGAAIKTIGRLVQKVACTFPESSRYFPAGKTTAVGYPVRPALRAATRLPKEEALAQFQLTAERPTLFVFGGSRGAWSLNRALMRNLPQLLETLQIIHISGTLTWPQVEGNAQQLPAKFRPFYRPYPYLHEQMGAAYRAADLIVARAGASMLGEGPLFGTPAVLVPYPHAWRYQKVNADYLAARGAAIRLNDDRLETDLLPTVLNLMQNKERLAQMAAAAAKLREPSAARRLAQMILTIGRRQYD